MPGARCVTWFDVCASGLPSGVTAVVNLAGQNILDPKQRWTPGFKQNVWNSRVNTTFTLAKAIASAAQKPKVFVTVSGVGIYRPHPELEYTEKSEIESSFDFLSKLATEWEASAKLPPEINVRQVIIRSGVVLGRHGGMIKEMYLPFFLGVGGPIASGLQPLPWIHIKDLCSMFLFAIENENVNGVMNGVAPQLITNEEFTKAFGRAMRRPTFFRVPEFLLNYMFSAERAKIMTKGQKVHPHKAKEYGFQYEYPTIDMALKDCARLFYSKKKPI
ncbi:hypothetical protein AAG570_013440 [Ranatra chinensis]|uniref:Nucleoside-diphosphate sugar epimerase n=1 Tax=Ranatra chinensis TaxID=642074 RepID=A0ABD0YC75_9HEMI